jgi:hypothetical protein
MEISFKSLDLSEDELQERVIEAIADKILGSAGINGALDFSDAVLRRELNKAVQERMDRGFAELAEKYILPNITTILEELTLQKTNQWGERKGPPCTFIEFFTQCAENYLTEKVDFEGKSAKEQYHGALNQTRAVYLIHQQLHHDIEKGMREALRTLEAKLVGGLQKTAADILAELVAKTSIKIP